MSLKLAQQNRDFTKKPLTRKDTQLHMDPDEPKLVQQHLNENGKLDTTSIVAHAHAHGVLTHTRDNTARYIDATAHTDFAQSLNTKIRADQQFAELPEEVRKKFHNDQREFVDFALDPKNIEQLREWGLAPALKTTDPLKVEVINQPTTEAPKAD